VKKSNKESIIIAKHISSFLNDYIPFQSGSDNTAKSHECAIALFLNFLETEKKVSPEKLKVECFSQETIEEWLYWLSEKRNCSPQTCNVRLGSIRTFLKYLSKKEVSMIHVFGEASQIERRKQMRRKVTGMSKIAVQALLNAPNEKTAIGRRDIALMVSLYGTAARIDEMLSTKIEQLYLDAKKPYAIIIGKGKKPRTLYLLPKAVAHLKEYIKEYHGDYPDQNSYVFYSRNGGLQQMMSQTAVNKRLKLYAKKAHEVCKEVPLSMHAHKLRHAKASHWLEDGINILQISLLLGHEKLETTEIYLDVTLEQTTEALATLEDEKTKNIPKKWKGKNSSLSEMCGVRTIL